MTYKFYELIIRQNYSHQICLCSLKNRIKNFFSTKCRIYFLPLFFKSKLMNIQHQLFEHIKNHFSKATYSLVEDVCQLLNIEKSTAYKRISGETPLKLEEIKKICNHFNVSLDSILFMGTASNISSFKQETYYKKFYSFHDYLQSFAATFDSLRKGRDNTLINLNNYLPVFYLFSFPHLTYFAYLSSKNENEDYRFFEQPITHFNIDDKDVKIMKYMAEEYARHPSTEILSPILFDSIIHRVLIAIKLGMIDDVLKVKLKDDILSLCHHIEHQCAVGKKISIYNKVEGADTIFLENNIQYFGYNEIYYCTDGYELCFVGNNLSNYLSTSDKNYCSYIKSKFIRIKNTSVNITIDNSLDRIQFFNGLRNKIQSSLG